MGGISKQTLVELAAECGFELSGVAPAEPVSDYALFAQWKQQGYGGEMRYLLDHRAELRRDPRLLLPSAKSVICVGKLYHAPGPRASVPELLQRGEGGISRYAWGEDYHVVVRRGLERLRCRLAEVAGSFESKICVDTSPLLERSLARRAGLGWIGKNTCLINERTGSWYFLGVMLVSLKIEPDEPPPDRCGSCSRCIDACPTSALTPRPASGPPGWMLDARRCISYLTIELRGAVPEELREATGPHIFGCDICQDVCPWNRRAPVTGEAAFAARPFPRALEAMAALSESEFHQAFRNSPVKRAKYAGFMRNVAIAMGNCRMPRFLEPLHRLAASAYTEVSSHAQWAIDRILSRRDT